MIQSKFYYKVSILGGISPYVVQAPAVTALPLPAQNPSYGQVVMLESEVGDQPQGMYVLNNLCWLYALSTIDLSASLLRGDAISVYVNPTSVHTAPGNALVYLNGELTNGTDINPGTGVYLVRTPPAGGSGGAVDSVNGQQGVVTVNATNLPGLATVGKTNNYNDLDNKPTLAIASTAVLGGVIVPAASKLVVDAQGNIDIKPNAVLANIVSVGQGNSLYAAVTNGLLAMKSLSSGTGITIVDDGTGNLIVSASGSSYTLPAATTTALGGVKVGTGLAVTVDGTLSVTSVAAPVTLTGDVTGNGTGTIATTLANSGVTAGTYSKVTVDAKGRVTVGAALASVDVTTALGYTPYNGVTNPNGYLTANAPTTLTGDATGTGTGSITVVLATTGVAAGTYKSVTVDTKGRVTAGTNPTTLAGYGITDALGSSGGSLTGVLTLSAGGKVTGVPTAVSPSDAVNLQQLQDAVAAAMTVGTWKTAVQAATTANLAALTGLLVIDTYQTVAGDRVLVKDQTTQSQNGVYIAGAGAWTRSTDLDTGTEIFGAAILVLMGTVNKFSQWVNSNSTAPTVGTDPITWAQLATAGQAYSAGAGLSLNGSNQFSITPSGVTAGTYTKVTVNALGQVTVGTALASSDVTAALGYTPYNSSNPDGYITAAGIPATTLTGDVTGTGNGTFATTLANSGVTAGVYTKVTVDAKGRVTLGAQLASADVTAALGYTPVNKAGDTLTGAVNWAPTVTVASAATTTIGTGVASNSVSITGSVTITSLGAGTAGMQRYVTFAGAPTLTNSAAIVLPSGTNIVVAAGDTALFISQGGTNWKCISYQRADGTALIAGGASDPTKLPLAGGTMSGALNEAPLATVASAATTAIGAANANSVNISGAVTITAFDAIAAGATRRLVFAGALTLTNNANIVLPGSANITTAAGDVAEMLSLGGGVWKCVNYVRVTGLPVVVSSTFSTTQRFNGSVTNPAIKLANAVEMAVVVSAAPAATQNFYVADGAVQYHTVNATANWVLNFAFSASQSMNTTLLPGESMTVAMLTTQGATAFLPSSYAIDGVAVTPRWQGGTAPTAGNANAIDVYTFTILKTAASTYTVLAAQTQYK